MRLKLLLLLLISIRLSSYAQKQPISNTVESSHIVIINKLKETYVCGGAANKLEKAFGKTKVLKEPDEVLGGFAYTYKYPGFEVYFNEKNWEAMDLTANNYTVLLDGQPVTVGDHISKLSSRFPLSYKSRKKGGIHLGITYKSAMMDSYISISYNAKGIIDRIIIANDNS